MLDGADLQRYKRQILYEGFGEEAQRRLKQSRVVVAGVGGLGCPASMYLACAGVGHITLIDHETVELSNLNRQVLHWEQDIGEKKVTSAFRKLTGLNPSIEVKTLELEITDANARNLVGEADVVIDALDNFETRSVLNRACVSEGIPLVHGGVWGFNGEVTTIIPGQTPCLACIYPREPREMKPVPVFGASPGLIGIIQATEALKLVARVGRPLAGRMLYVNQANMDFAFRELVRNPDCRVCGHVEEIT